MVLCHVVPEDMIRNVMVKMLSLATMVTRIIHMVCVKKKIVMDTVVIIGTDNQFNTPHHCLW